MCICYNIFVISRKRDNMKMNKGNTVIVCTEEDCYKAHQKMLTPEQKLLIREINRIRQNPYACYTVPPELQNHIGINAQAIVGFKALKKEAKEQLLQARLNKDSVAVSSITLNIITFDSILGYLYKKLNNELNGTKEVSTDTPVQKINVK